MAHRTYLLTDTESGELVGLHVVAGELEFSSDEIATIQKTKGHRRLHVEEMSRQPRVASKTHRPGEKADGASFGGGGLDDEGNTDAIERRYERLSDKPGDMPGRS
jgi:hypothetical protein